ncbi:MAG: flagellar motor protein MotB [Phycisphaerae bacterium]|jgi:chemotaxis protein MotB
MGREKKPPEPEQVAGAPEWMVTFSDTITLMLTFFVLLFSFSSFNESITPELSTGVAGSPFMFEGDNSAFIPTEQIISTKSLETGSEKPTLMKGTQGGLENKDTIDYHNRKVFLFSSKELFLGRGVVISLEGHNALSKMASFLKEVSGRIVISENGQEDDEDSKEFGLLRAWAVMEYLTTKQGLDKGWFSLAADTLQRNRKNGQQDHSQVKAERTLEIVLLDRSIYN